MSFDETENYIEEAFGYTEEFSEHFYLEANSMASQRINFIEGSTSIDFDDTSVYGETQFIDIYGREEADHYGYVEVTNDDRHTIANIIMAAKSCDYDGDQLEKALADKDILLQR